LRAFSQKARVFFKKHGFQAIFGPYFRFLLPNFSTSGLSNQHRPLSGVFFKKHGFQAFLDPISVSCCQISQHLVRQISIGLYRVRQIISPGFCF
jgi:hypothetical protein